jgi:hypothetical protein
MQASHHRQDGALATATMADNRNEFSFGDVHREIADSNKDAFVSFKLFLQSPKF